MNVPIIRKYLALLRSGEIEQARTVMHVEQTGAMCCLGVFCELHRRETDSNANWMEGNVKGGAMLYMEEDAYAPREVWAWGFGPHYMHLQNLLIGFNDSQNQNFHQIADYIEHRVLKDYLNGTSRKTPSK